MGADSTHRMEEAQIDEGGIRMASEEVDRILEVEEDHTGHIHKEVEVADTLSTSSADSFRRAVGVVGAVCCFWPLRSSFGMESSSSRLRRNCSRDSPLEENQSSIPERSR